MSNFIAHSTVSGIVFNYLKLWGDEADSAYALNTLGHYSPAQCAIERAKAARNAYFISKQILKSIDNASI